MHPFAPRPVSCTAILEHEGWRLKRYDIQYDAGPLDESGFEAGVALALASLPKPAVAPGRAGVGFLIRHQGRGAHYLVLGWWDSENELPMRVFARREDEHEWRPARGSESVCIWDLEVLWFERNAYVETFLAPNAGAPAQATASWLERTLEVKRPATPAPVLSR